MRKRFTLIAAMALVVAACGGSAETSTSTAATTPTSTTSLVRVPTTLPPTTTTVAVDTRSVEEFLAVYYEAVADLTMADPGFSGVREYGADFYAVRADALSSFSESMSGLRPPAAAKTEYARGMAVWGDHADLYGSVTGDPAAVSARLDVVSDEIVRLGVIVAGIEVAFNEVAAQALADLDTDITLYLAQGVALRGSFESAFSEALLALLSDDLEIAENPEQLREIAETLLFLAGDWSLLDVPDEIRLLQDDQALVFDLTIGILALVADAIEGGVALTSDELATIVELETAERFVTSGWAYATAAVFRGDGDILVAYAGPEIGPSASTSADVFVMGVGTCFDDVGGDTIYELPVVDCGDPHDNEVFYGFDVVEEAFPGVGPVDDLASAGCFEEFEDFVGSSYEQSALFMSWLVPTEASWAVGDQEILCFIWQPDEKLMGTMEASGL